MLIQIYCEEKSLSYNLIAYSYSLDDEAYKMAYKLLPSQVTVDFWWLISFDEGYFSRNEIQVYI